MPRRPSPPASDFAVPLRPLTGWVAPKRFLIDILLKELVAVYYSHPEAWSAIGFGGPASPRGYVRTQLDKHDPWEAVKA